MSFITLRDLGQDAVISDPGAMQVRTILTRAQEDFGQGKTSSAQSGLNFAKTFDQSAWSQYEKDTLNAQMVSLASALAGTPDAGAQIAAQGGGVSKMEISNTVFRNDANFQAQQDANAVQTGNQFDAQHATDGQACTTSKGTPGVLFGGICAKPSAAGWDVCDFPSLKPLCDLKQKLGSAAVVATVVGAIGLGVYLFGPAVRKRLNRRSRKH